MAYYWKCLIFNKIPNIRDLTDFQFYGQPSAPNSPLNWEFTVCVQFAPLYMLHLNEHDF